MKVPGGRHFDTKGCPGNPKRRQQSPKEHPKGSQRGPKGEKKWKNTENYDTFILNDPMGVWLHLHPSARTGTRKNTKHTHNRKHNNARPQTKTGKNTTSSNKNGFGTEKVENGHARSSG